MSDTLTASEAKYFDTKGAEAPAEGAGLATPDPAPVTEPDAATPQPAETTSDGAEPPSDGEPKTVRHEALREERELRKKAERSHRELESRYAADMARLQERLDIIQRAYQQPQQPQTPPQFAEDPAGYVQHLERQVQQLQTRQQEQDSAQRWNQQVSALQNWGVAQEQEFARRQPDYNDAAAYLRELRDRQLTDLGVSDPAQRAQMIAQDVAQIAIHSHQQNVNFGERVYQLAKTSGYKPKGNGQQAPGEQVSANEQKLQQIERGQQLGTSVGSVGQAPAPGLTAHTLLQMSDDEFLKMIKTPKGKDLLGR